MDMFWKCDDSRLMSTSFANGAICVHRLDVHCALAFDASEVPERPLEIQRMTYGARGFRLRQRI